MRVLSLIVPLLIAPAAAALPPIDWKSLAPDRPRDVAYSTDAVRAAIDKSLPLLLKSMKGHSGERSCFSCHHHAMPLLALATARGRGFAIDATELDEQIEFVTGYWKEQRPRLLGGTGPGPAPAGGAVDTTGYALLALDALTIKPDDTTRALIEYTLKHSSGKNFWETAAARPPSERSTFTTTYLAIRGLKRFAHDDQRKRADERIAKARSWLEKTPAKDTEDRVFRLLGLKESGADEAIVKQAADELLKSQREDGGWGQLDTMFGDAYATGTALVALHWSGRLPADDPAYRRGLTFLLGTQRDDGSWRIRSRSRPFQKYFETGFPHKKDQFISCSASAWATTALALALPAK